MNHRELAARLLDEGIAAEQQFDVPRDCPRVDRPRKLRAEGRARYGTRRGERLGEEARRVTDTIRTVTGSHAQTLEDFFKANAAEFGSVAAVRRILLAPRWSRTAHAASSQMLRHDPL